MFGNLCEELMVEILTRLPPKSLLRFRSVSKSLRSCIDSPAFVGIHTSRSPQRLLFTHIVHSNHTKYSTLHGEDQLPLCPKRGYTGITATKFPGGNLNFVGLCNGILLLLDYGNGMMTLWNPSIMRQLTLPDYPRRCSNTQEIGIGFDPITDDNKIVSIPLFGGILESSFVYAMKTRAWRPIASPMPLYSRVISKPCYLNGVLHWLVERCFPDSNNVELRYIMKFDLRTHVFGMIDLPKLLWKTYKLATIEGSLAVISTVSGSDWISVRRDDSWPVVFKSETIKARGGLRKVLELGSNGDLLLDDFRDGLKVYSPKTGELSALVDFNDTSSILDMDMYVETLQLLHIGTACDISPI